jgi:hemerythrin-like domain-containing protein
MKITDGLLGEHALFYQLFDALEDVMSNASSAEDIQRAFAPLSRGVLSHATIENDILFTAIAQGGSENGITAAMRTEHREIEALSNAISKTRTLDEAHSAGQSLLDLLRDHFQREEEILFPLCEHALEPSRLEELGDRYKRERGLR